jgi:3-deoxy-D-manno-octulosonic-acid transferase
VTYLLYTALLAAGVTGYAPVALARRLMRGVPLNLRARLGFGTQDGGRGPRGWVHAVSVGEAITAAPLLEGLRRAYPELPLVVSTVTPTGARVVGERFAQLASHRYFPLDFPGAVRRTIAAIDPAFFVCMETELWPNMLRALARRGVPTMIANGRISDHSFGRYKLVRPALRSVLANVRVFGMRSDEDARRIIALGAPPERVMVTGNLKNDAPADPAGAADLWRRLLGLPHDQRVWIAGSTHNGEDEIVLAAHAAALAAHPGLTLILAPRHPERVDEVLGLIAARGWRGLRRSALPAARRTDGGKPGSTAAPGPTAAPGSTAEPGERSHAASRTAHPRLTPEVIVVDTVGELAQIYALADVVFVGGSLVPRGGHNVLEPALRGKPVLIGPHTDNFREAAGQLLGAGGAVTVEDAAALGAELRALLADPALAARRGEAAFASIAAQHGAVRQTLDLVAQYLAPDAPGRSGDGA